MADPIIDVLSRPFPFIFLGKNIASAAHGATIAYNDFGQTAQPVAGYPVANIIDGSRESACHVDDIAGETGNYASFHLDMSTSFETEEEINVILLECDPKYPIDRVEVKSYTDSGFSLGTVTHDFDNQEYVAGTYYAGLFQRANNISKRAWPSTSRPNGFDTQYTFLYLKVPIASDHPYVRFNVRRIGRNIFGSDFSFDNGLWDGEPAPPNGPTIITSDPYPNTKGANNNHILLTLTGKSADQLTQDNYVNMDPDSEYILKFAEKKSAVGDSTGQYRIYIEYRDIFNNTLGTEFLMRDIGSYNVGSWGEMLIRINYKDPGSAARLSGIPSSEAVHSVPDGARMFRFWFLLSDVNTVNWKIDDIYLYRTSIPFGFKYHSVQDYNSKKSSIIDVEDTDGLAKIRRIGMFEIDYFMSKYHNGSPSFHDLAGLVLASPQSQRESHFGIAYNRNFNGKIVGKYTAIGGAKKRKSFSVIMTKEQKDLFIDRMKESVGIGIYEPQGDWGEYEVLISTLKTNVAVDVSDNASNYFWSVTFDAEER
jgi:hypothetical protein